jgi:hypothetical protein
MIPVAGILARPFQAIGDAVEPQAASSSITFCVSKIDNDPYGHNGGDGRQLPGAIEERVRRAMWRAAARLEAAFRLLAFRYSIINETQCRQDERGSTRLDRVHFLGGHKSINFGTRELGKSTRLCD